MSSAEASCEFDLRCSGSTSSGSTPPNRRRRRPHRAPRRAAAVAARRPGAGSTLSSLNRRAVLGVESPVDAGTGDPVADLGELVVVEAEARLTGAVSARSSTSEAVTRRDASSSSRATTREHRVDAAQRAVGEPYPQGGSRPRAREPPRPPTRVRRTSPGSAARTLSMSGHMTIMSRGSSVGSSARRWRIASRSTSTWRARPWQAWIRTLSSSAASSSRSSAAPAQWRRRVAGDRRGCRPAGARSSVVGCTLRGRREWVVGDASPRSAPAAAPASRGPTRPAGGSAELRGRVPRAGAASSADCPRSPCPTAPARGAAASGGRRGRPRAPAAPGGGRPGAGSARTS